MVFPISSILITLFTVENEAWDHLVETVLPGYVLNSLHLMLGVAVMTSILGISTAWLVARYRFAFSGFFTWALMLPLAFPAYILGYAYAGIFDHGSYLDTLLPGSAPDILNIHGAVLVFSLALYPYVYMLVKTTFLRQSQTVLEASRALGVSDTKSFFRVALPLARPAWVGGVMLALMETLSDFGTVDYYGVDTFTTGIFRIWFGMGDTGSAINLAAMLLGFILLLIGIEKWESRRRGYAIPLSQHRPAPKKQLHGGKSLLACIWCLLILGAGFCLPLYWLLDMAMLYRELQEGFLELFGVTFLIAFAAAAVTVSIALILLYAQRIYPATINRLALKGATLGYAVPGAVIAVGIMIPLNGLDHLINDTIKAMGGNIVGLIFSGTFFALLFGYAVRFMAVAIFSLESGLKQLPGHIEEAAFSLKASGGKTFWKIFLPVLRQPMLTALVIVFVDTLKELPATLILRPFNFETLATRAYELASNEMLVELSHPALAIVGIGLIPVILINRAIHKE